MAGVWSDGAEGAQRQHISPLILVESARAPMHMHHFHRPKQMLSPHASNMS